MTDAIVPSIPEPLADLNRRDRRIVAEFIQCHDMWTAAKRAGLVTEKLNQNFINGLKKRLTPFINAYEDWILGELDISANRLIEEVALLAFYDPADIVDAQGELKVSDLSELGPLSRVVAGIEHIVNTKDHTETTKVKLYSRKDALELLMRAKGLFKDTHISGPPIQFNVNFGGTDGGA